MASSLVIQDLRRWGPDQNVPPPSLTDSQAYCRRLAQAQYENFPVVTWMLPRALRQHFYNVYAFCRWADDLGDESGSPAEASRLLGWWRAELQACYQGQLRHPVFVALRPTIDRFQIPARPFEDLISAFEQDQQVRHYDTFDQLLDYCRRSANPVGRIVLMLAEQATPENLIWSDSICTGLQLANFWQDVARDAEIGRIYLPVSDRQTFGYTDAQFAEHHSTPEFQALLKFEVDRARDFLLQGKPLIRNVPGRLRIDFDLFLQGGVLILDAIEQVDYQVWERRPVLRKSDFAKAALRSLWRCCLGGR